jgi:peptide/nickel transport system substrate-binding protein
LLNDLLTDSRVGRLTFATRLWSAPHLAGQEKIAAEMQAQAFIDVPYIPLGVFYNPSVYRRDITEILHSFPIFWNMRRA